MKKYIKSASTSNNQRVIQLSFDVLTDDSMDSTEIVRLIDNLISVEGEKHGFRCVGSEFITDLTDEYREDYSYVFDN